MSANQNKVRRKEIAKSTPKNFYIFLVAGLVILLGVTFTVAISSFSTNSKSAEIINDGNRQIIRVPVGGDLQASINSAQSGDIIELQAGATYSGDIKLPKKDIKDYITIQSSNVSQLPANTRVKPTQSNLMAKIVTKGEGTSAVSAEPGAHHYRFIGIEFTPATEKYIYNLVYLASGTPKITDVPHHFEFDRCYFHPHKTGITRRGFGANSAFTTIKNSYFEGFAFAQEETQAIAGWTGTKNLIVTNNYLEGGAENIVIGGGDPASAELIPADIEISGNHFYKPAAWKGKVVVKCLFELKNAKRVQFIGNYLENNWIGAAFRITVRNEEGGAPFSTLEDILIQDNVINGAGDNINILGSDDLQPSQTIKRITITNNLFLNIGGSEFDGSGYFLQVNNGEDILVANNTSFNTGNIATFYGVMPKNFVFRDNIVGHGNYGVQGLENFKINGQSVFQNNLFINNKNISSDNKSFPTGNFWMPDYKSPGFMNSNQNDFRLLPNSQFKGKGKDKSDIGSNLDIKQIVK